ncbi:hypothetical protein ACX27O_15400 [Micromonospora sp. SD19]
MATRRISTTQIRQAVFRAQQQLRQAKRQLQTSAADARRAERKIRQAINHTR